MGARARVQCCPSRLSAKARIGTYVPQSVRLRRQPDALSESVSRRTSGQRQSVATARSVRRTAGPGPPASAPRAARTPRPPRSPSPSRSAAMPSATSAAERSSASSPGRQHVHQAAVVQLDQRARMELLQPAPHVDQAVDQRPLVHGVPQRPQRPRHPPPGLHHRRPVAQHRRGLAGRPCSYSPLLVARRARTSAPAPARSPCGSTGRASGLRSSHRS